MDIIQSTDPVARCGSDESQNLGLRLTLGNTTVYAYPTSGTGCNNLTDTFPDFRVAKFHTQSLAREALGRFRRACAKRPNRLMRPDKPPEWRVYFCMRSLVAGYASVYRSLEHESAHYGGLMVCGSVWTCPVCAAKIAARRSAELSAAVADSGLTPILVTYTIQHKRTDSLGALLKDLAAARRHVFSGAAKNRLYDLMGVVGYVAALEIRYGERNGWHPHYHQLILSERMPDELNAEEIRVRLLSRFGKKLDELGYQINRHTLDVQVSRSVGGNVLDKYLTKISAELTLGYRKDGRCSYSPFQLLHLWDQGKRWALKRFREYADSTFGRKFLQHSRGMLDLLGLRDESDLEVVERQEDSAVLLAMLNREQWRRVLRDDLRAELLSFAEIYDSERLLRWLVERRVVLGEEVAAFRSILEKTRFLDEGVMSDEELEISQQSSTSTEASQRVGCVGYGIGVVDQSADSAVDRRGVAVRPP